MHDLREYQPGDDVRTIDWNVTARTDRPYVREAELERALDVWLVADVSASVAWGTASALKSDRAGELAAAAGLILGRRGHRIGAVLFDNRPIAFIPPGAGRGHVTRLLIALRERSGQVSAGSTDLAAALDRTGFLARRSGLILIVSDFFVRPGWQATLDRLARRHEVVAVRVADPREADLPDVGLVTLEDPETGGQLLVDTGDAGLRARYRVAATAQAERLAGDLTARGVDLQTVRTDEPLLPALARFLATRRHRRGRPGPTTGLPPSGLRPTG